MTGRWKPPALGSAVWEESSQMECKHWGETELKTGEDDLEDKQMLIRCGFVVPRGILQPWNVQEQTWQKHMETLGVPLRTLLSCTDRCSRGWMGKEDKYDRGHLQSFLSIQKQATQVLVILTETQSNVRWHKESEGETLAENSAHTQTHTKTCWPLQTSPGNLYFPAF